MKVMRSLQLAAVAAVLLLGGALVSCSAAETPTPSKTTVTVYETEDAIAPGSARVDGEVDLSIPANVVAVQTSEQASVAVEPFTQRVRCQFQPGPTVVCDVLDATYLDELAADAAWCAGPTEGKLVGFAVDVGEARSTCVDSLFPESPARTVILQDGRAAQSGDLICKSPDGASQVTCWNTTTQHGFSISDRSYQTF